MKTFISYAKPDRETATALYRDLAGAGVELFRYGASETLGVPVWTEIFDWIARCDAFVVLISPHSLRSSGVQAEVEQANYRFIQSEGEHPSRIVSVLLDATARPPTLIERFSTLDLTDYAAGKQRLLDQLGVAARATRAPAASLLAPVVDASPAPATAEAHEWSVGASRLLDNYRQLKPADLREEEETEHVNALLAAYTGKSPTTFAAPQTLERADAAFRGVEKGEVDPSPLVDLLLRDPVPRLEAPELRAAARGFGHVLLWNPVPGASDYELQSSPEPSFGAPVTVYRGTETSFDAGATLLATSYRVRAKGGKPGEDSDWSAPIVAGGARRPLVSGRPVLSARRLITNVVLSWTAVAGASEYVLERSMQLGSSVFGWDEIYRGTTRMYTDTAGGVSTMRIEYRVKATGLGGDGPWSATVTA